VSKGRLMNFAGSAAAFAVLASLAGPAMAQAGLSIELFKEPGFRGESRVYYGEAPTLKKDGFGAVAKSARVRGAWTVCRLSQYKGACSELRHDEPDLAKVGLADAIMSAKPAPVTQAFADPKPNPGYRGDFDDHRDDRGGFRPDDRDRYSQRPEPGSAAIALLISKHDSRLSDEARLAISQDYSGQRLTNRPGVWRVSAEKVACKSGKNAKAQITCTYDLGGNNSASVSGGDSEMMFRAMGDAGVRDQPLSEGRVLRTIYAVRCMVDDEIAQRSFSRGGSAIPGFSCQFSLN